MMQLATRFVPLVAKSFEAGLMLRRHPWAMGVILLSAVAWSYMDSIGTILFPPRGRLHFSFPRDHWYFTVLSTGTITSSSPVKLFPVSLVPTAAMLGGQLSDEHGFNCKESLPTICMTGSQPAARDTLDRVSSCEFVARAVRRCHAHGHQEVALAGLVRCKIRGFQNTFMTAPQTFTEYHTNSYH